MREAVEVQLDPEQTPRERARRVARVVRCTEYWRTSNARAARSHRKHRLRALHRIGIRLSTLKKCFHVF